MQARLLPLLLVLAGCGSVEYGGDVAYGQSTASYTMAEPTAIGSSPAPTQARIEIEVFLQELAPYGQWLQHPQYGQVFLPHDTDYRPYRNGHWAQSGEDLAWVSYDAIGWAVCHYGSWTVLEDGRWAWVPDSQWSPAWVDWRETDEYVGWAPRMVSVAPMPTAWIFVQSSYLLYDSVSYYAVEPSYVQTVYASGRPMRSRPDRRWMRDRGVQRATGRSVAVRPGRGAPPGARSASGGSVVVRDGIPDARARGLTVRGPARAPLLDGRPRETVVLGRRPLARDPVVYSGGQGPRRVAPSVTVDRPVAAPPPRGPVYSAGPRVVAPSPTPRVFRAERPMPQAPPPRVYAPPVQAAPRTIVQRPQPQPYREPRMVAPRVVAPAVRSEPRVVQSRSEPRRETPRRSERRVEPERRGPNVRGLRGGATSVRPR